MNLAQTENYTEEEIRSESLNEKIVSSELSPRSVKIAGLCSLGLGLLMAVLPVVSTIAIEMVVAVIGLLSGIALLLHSVSAKKWRATLAQSITGALYTLAGAYLLLNPVTGSLILSGLLGFLFLIEGIVGITFSQVARSETIMPLLSSCASFLLGGLMIFALPEVGPMALGLLFGLNLIMSGLAFFSYGAVLEKNAAM